MLSCPQCLADCQDAHRFCHACGFVLPADAPGTGGDPFRGRTLPGGYVIQELIAEGSMGRIYRATQPKLDRVVAVKIIHPHLATDESVVARFLVEVRAASRLSHANAVNVIAFGNTTAGQPYLVMQLLKGRHLRAVADAEGPLAPSRIVDILTQMLGALEQAHDLSIVHGDVKPENVIVERLHSGRDLVKVIDFGLAQILEAGAGLVSEEGPPGTPAYMSPEQARGERIDRRSDVYSVGVILYELLTGVPPFAADSDTETLLAVVSESPMDPRERAPARHVPDQLAEVAARALAKDPDARFQTADELSRALSTGVVDRSRETGRPCPKCGAGNVARRAYCGECGASLSGGKPETRGERQNR